MKAADLSPLFPITFCNNPDPDTIRRIPVEKPAKGMASFERGFPNETMLPLAAGGAPPDGRDMNGILNMLSRAIRAYEAGEIRPYSADYAQQIGGYPQGAMVVADMPTPRILISLKDDNVTPPTDEDDTTWYDLTGHRRA